MLLMKVNVNGKWIRLDGNFLAVVRLCSFVDEFLREGLQFIRDNEIFQVI